MYWPMYNSPVCQSQLSRKIAKFKNKWPDEWLLFPAYTHGENNSISIHIHQKLYILQDSSSRIWIRTTTVRVAEKHIYTSALDAASVEME